MIRWAEWFCFSRAEIYTGKKTRIGTVCEPIDASMRYSSLSHHKHHLLDCLSLLWLAYGNTDIRLIYLWWLDKRYHSFFCLPTLGSTKWVFSLLSFSPDIFYQSANAYRLESNPSRRTLWKMSLHQLFLRAIRFDYGSQKWNFPSWNTVKCVDRYREESAQSDHCNLRLLGERERERERERRSSSASCEQRAGDITQELLAWCVYQWHSCLWEIVKIQLDDNTRG